MSLGLKRGTVQLEPHDKQWDEAAIQTIKILKSILGAGRCSLPPGCSITF